MLLKHVYPLLALAGTCLAAPAQAQTLPNASLDTWLARPNGERPTGWLTTDDAVTDLLGTPAPFSTNTVVKTAGSRTGAFAAQLQTQTITGFGEVPGGLLVGNRYATNPGFPGGVGYAGRPARLEFYYKLSGALALADSATAKVLLTTTVNGTRTVVGGAAFLFRVTAASYSLVSMPITYASALRPDSVRLVFSSGDADVIHAGTVLTIDDVALAGTAAATRDAALNAALAVAPNPSPDGRYRLTASADLAPELLAAPLAVLDATGRVVRREAAPATAPAGGRTLDLSGLPEGIYTLQLFTERGLVTRKLVR